MKKTHVLELSNNPWKCTCSSEITQRVSTSLEHLLEYYSRAESLIFFLSQWNILCLYLQTLEAHSFKAEGVLVIFI